MNAGNDRERGANSEPPARPWGEPSPDPASDPARQPSPWQSQQPSAQHQQPHPHQPPPKQPGWKRFPLLTALFAVLAFSLVGARAYQELSGPNAWSYWKDQYFSPSMTASLVHLNAAGGQQRTALAVSGAIGPAAAGWFRGKVDEAGLAPGDMIILSSPGGTLDQGIIMGDIIRARGLTTAVGIVDSANRIKPSYCASACVMTFAGGAVRVGVSGSQLGVHQFSRTIDSKESESDIIAGTQRTTGRILAFMTRMGVSPDILQKMSASKDIEWLSAKDAASLRLVTAPYVAP